MTTRFDDLTRRLGQAESRRTALKMLGGGLAAGAVATTGYSAVVAKKDDNNRGGRNPLENVRVRGLNEDGKLAFKGLLDITGFEVDGDTLYAVGDLTGKVKKAPDGDKTWSFVDVGEVRLPILLEDDSGAVGASAVGVQATCTILVLTLGSIEFNVLGLVIETNTIKLRITGEQGGGLIGELLCLVAGLLDGGLGGGVLDQISDLLNQILGILEGL